MQKLTRCNIFIRLELHNAITNISMHLIYCGVIWYHRSESTLAQHMVCCLMALNYYQNQCSYRQRCSVEFIWEQFYKKCSWLFSVTCVQRWHFKITTKSPRGQGVQKYHMISKSWSCFVCSQRASLWNKDEKWYTHSNFMKSALV